MYERVHVTEWGHRTRLEKAMIEALVNSGGSCLNGNANGESMCGMTEETVCHIIPCWSSSSVDVLRLQAVSISEGAWWEKR